jgi:carboxyl-terminal processing protease
LTNPNEQADTSNSVKATEDNSTAPLAEEAQPQTNSTKASKKTKPSDSPNANKSSTVTDKTDNKKTPIILTEKELIDDDYVLFAALNILKGAAFWQPKP